MRAGGVADKSFLDFAYFDNWLNTRVAAGTLVVPGPVVMESAMTLDGMEELINHAHRNEKGEIENSHRATLFRGTSCRTKGKGDFGVSAYPLSDRTLSRRD